jgi:predicted nuclease of restriction endonuclease-like (RecB) superfamily
MQKAVENGWTRDVMVLQIENKLYERQGKAITNFSTTLPAEYSDFATETLKSPYIIDFLSLTEEMKERDIENGLIQHMKKFMLELGRGFAYVGNQKNINVDGDDFFLDLLFFNYNLDCFVIFELKVGAFKPEFAGKLNFYVNTVNEQIKLQQHKPTIGVLLCKTPNKTVIEYSLKGIESPIGVANYELIKALPKELRGEIPSIEELEREIEGEYTELLKPVDKKIVQLNDLIKGLKQPHAKEIRSAINCERILVKVVFFLRNSIKKMLEEKGISEKFADLEMMVWTDGQGKKSDKEVRDHLKQRGEVGEFRIELRLNGFKPAGTKAFNIWKDLSIATNSYNYTIGFERQSQNTLLEKLYHQLPDKKELETILDKWMEAIIDSITQQLELINQISK